MMRKIVHASPSHAGHLVQGRWWRKHGYPIRLIFCFLAITLATVYVKFFERSGPAVNLIWMATGLWLTYLLLAPRWRWPGYLIAGTAAMTLGSVLIGESWQTNLLYNILNLVEVLIGALLLRRKSTQLPRFTNRKYLIRFVGFAVLLGPMTAGGILTVVTMLWRHNGNLNTFLDWLIADGLGTAITVPTFVAIFQTRFTNSASLKKYWQYPLVLVAVTLAAFIQNRMPLFILIFPVLVLLLMRLGLGWAALATLFVSATVSWYSIHDLGPFAISGTAYSVGASIQLQFFVACCIFMIYLVSVILEERDATEYRLEEISSIHSMVTDNSRDVIMLADLDGVCTYVSPALEVLNGWKPEYMINQKLAVQAHPDDRHRVEESIRRIRHTSESVIVEYRIQKRNGDYIWIESSLRLFRHRKTRIPAGILILVRDITERKHNEDLLLSAYGTLEELAIVDALTGVANRRKFDEHLAREWSRAARLQTPTSMLLIDADCFKQHNDSYGHLSGDRCLKQIAEAAMTAAKRPEDLVARIGGDEFAIILSDTDNQGAVAVAGKIREVFKQRSSARKEESEALVTISIGCATLIPEMTAQPETLIQIADKALYEAKRNGRDQMCNGTLLCPFGESAVGDALERATHSEQSQ
jgi:diguanylate cyclase (GGDEF)-like protein/PAS domain S-box-containing protein